MFSKPCLALLALCTTTAAVCADPWVIAQVDVQQGEWTYVPIADDSGTTPRVEHVVALATSGQGTGDNLVAVWFSRGASDTDPWSAVSWVTTDVNEAIKSVKDGLGMSNVEDEKWPVGDLAVANAIQSPETPKEYQSGVLLVDPLAPLIVGSPSRDEIVELLADLGMKVADIDFEKTSGELVCMNERTLTAIAKGAENSLIGGTSPESVAKSYLDSQCQANFCVAWTWTTATTPWAWGPITGWTFHHRDAIPRTGGYQVLCCYWLTRTVSKTRTLTHRYWDCTSATCFQTKSKTIVEEQCCDDTATLWNGAPPIGACTATPTCIGTVPTVVTPNKPDIWQDWSPACPWD